MITNYVVTGMTCGHCVNHVTEEVSAIPGVTEVKVEQAGPMTVSSDTAIDFGTIGGLKEGKKITDLADLYSIPMAVHNIASPVGTVAAAQACATMNNFISLEHHAIAIPWWKDLVVGQDIVTDGVYKLNQQPGLGLELNERVVKEHLKQGEQYFD